MLQIVTGVLLSMVVVFGWIEEMAIGSNSLDQVILGSSIGIAICFTWFMLRDEASVLFIKLSEHVEFWQEKLRVIIFTIVCLIIFFVTAFFAHYWVIHMFNKAEDVPPDWVLEYENQCGRVKHPAFYYLHLQRIYNYLFFFVGVVLGVTIDSLLLGGTIVNYNIHNEMDMSIKGLRGLGRWLIAIGIWYLCQFLFGALFPFSMRNLWKSELWIMIAPMMPFSFVKYIYKALGLTKDFITFKDVERIWNEEVATKAELDNNDMK